MTIGEHIQEARKKAGLTQEELGEKIGVTGVAIMRYEKGKRQPRLEQLQAIAAALGVSVMDLLGPYEGPPLPGLVDGDSMEEVEPFHYSPARARISAALNRLPEEGQEKVAIYAEDLIPRYRAETAPQSTPAPTEGKDTTPPPDAPETAPEGK